MADSFSQLLDTLSAPQATRPDPEAAYVTMVRHAAMGRLPTADEARETLDRAHRSTRHLEADVATTTTDYTLAGIRLRAGQLADQKGRPAEVRTVAQRIEIAAKVLSLDHPLAVPSDGDLEAYMADWPENTLEDLAERLRVLAGTLSGSTAALDARSVLLLAAAMIEDPSDLAGTTAGELLRA